MIVFWVFILSIVLMTLFILVVKVQNQAWTLEAIRLLWTMTILVGLLLLMSILRIYMGVIGVFPNKGRLLG